EGDGGLMYHDVADHDGDCEPHAHEPRRARRLQCEGNRYQDHDEIDEREGELRVELHEVLLRVEARGVELPDVFAQLEIAHRGDRLLDVGEVLDALVEVEGRNGEGH